jgi:hypothetical protein
MRAEALQLSDLRKKRTKSAQTDVRFSHREVETQVRLLEEVLLPGMEMGGK